MRTLLAAALLLVASLLPAQDIVTVYEGSGGTFDPTSLSNGLYIAAHPDQTLTDVDGVYELSDLSPANNDLVQSTGSNKPDVVTAASGMDGIQGDGIDDDLVLQTAFSRTCPFTAVYLMEVPAASGSMIGLASDGSGRDFGSWFASATGLRIDFTTGPVTINDGTGPTKDTPLCVIYTCDSSDNLRAWVAEGSGSLSEVTSGSPTSAGSAIANSMGGWYSSGKKYHKSIYNRIAIYDADHTSDVTNLHTWCQEGLP